MFRPVRLLCAALLVTGSAGPARAVDKFADLLVCLPASLNAVVVCDVQSVYGSPLAVKDKWAATANIGFPAGIQQVVLGAHLDPATLHVTGEEFGVAYLKVRLTMDELAAREMGARDTLAGAEAVLSPRNAYFVSLRPWTVGMIAPANRQDACQWVKFTRNNPRPALSPFLAASVVNTDPKTQFVIAIDLADAVDPQKARARLAESRAATAAGANLEALAKFLAGVQGLRLDVSIGDDIRGELRVEFDREVGPFAALAKPLFEDVLAHRGAAVDEVADWMAEAAGKAVVFRGPLSEKAFRRVATILQPPSPTVGSGEETQQLAAELKQLASQYYFKMVTTSLEDLKKPTRQAKKSYENYALWYETYAKKIDELTPYNVDEDLLKYGHGVAERLRAIAASLRGDVVDVQALEKKISYGVSAGAWWGAPYLFVQTNQAQVQAAQREAIDRGEQARQEIWKTIEAATADVRSRMSQKFKTVF
jgi:hypothetical protein